MVTKVNKVDKVKLGIYGANFATKAVGNTLSGTGADLGSKVLDSVNPSNWFSGGFPGHIYGPIILAGTDLLLKANSLANRGIKLAGGAIYGSQAVHDLVQVGNGDPSYLLNFLSDGSMAYAAMKDIDATDTVKDLWKYISKVFKKRK